jgi:hypothetical protein
MKNKIKMNMKSKINKSMKIIMKKNVKMIMKKQIKRKKMEEQFQLISVTKSIQRKSFQLFSRQTDFMLYSTI